MTNIQADANPEKRLFISLLTRDITLIAAFMDLIDNSVNSALEPHAPSLRSADDYVMLLDDGEQTAEVEISIEFGEDFVTISDNATGISTEVAAKHVFKFGRAAKSAHETDRLSVYGIGLKRALFKLGDHASIISDHRDGGFELDLDVPSWAADATIPWHFPIAPRQPRKQKTGTTIEVRSLHGEVQERIDDGVFETQLREAVARTYAYFLGRFVTILINGKPVEAIDITVSQNQTSRSLDLDGLSCAISAGLGPQEAGQHRDKTAGWFVFCNGRVVVSADKSSLTGWGAPNGLPIFQPKHRPFLGMVYFASSDPELLPWTTTKAGINEDSAAWQRAKREMIAAARVVITFLDARYADEAPTPDPSDLMEARGGEDVDPMTAATGGNRAFTPPKPAAKSQTLRVQYDARHDDIDRVKEHLQNRSMSGSEIGRYTFDFFLKNEVG